MSQGITVDFNANVSRFTSSVDKMTNDLNKFQTNADRVSANVSKSFSALGAGLSVAGLTLLVKGTIDAADALKDMSDRTGVTIKDLASIKLAAEQSGTSLDGVAKSISKLSLSTGQAQQGNEEMAGALQRLGVNATDPIQRLSQLADAVQKNGTDTKTLADIQKVLGKSYAEVLPLLLQGGEALRESALASESYADAMARMAPDADKFNDQLAVMNTRLAGVGSQFVSAVLPSLNQYIGALDEILARGTLMDKVKFFSVGYISPDVVDKVTDYTIRTAQLREEIKRLRDAGEDAGPALERLNNLILNHKEPIKRTGGAGNVEEIRCIASGGTWDGENCKPKKTTARTGKSTAEKLYDENRALDKNNNAVDFASEWANIEGADDRARAHRDTIAALKAEYIALIDPVQAFRVKLDEIDQLEFEGAFSADQAMEARFRINEQIDGLTEIKDTGKDAFADLTRAVEGWGNAFTDNMVDMAMTGKLEFGKMADSIIRDLLRMTIQKNITDKLFDSFKSTDFISTIGNFFSGGTASANGNVFTGAGISAYSNQIVDKPTYFAKGGNVMGEAGPEAIIPLKRDSSGRLGISGGGSNVVVNVIESPGRGGQQEQRSEGGVNIVDVFVEKVKAAIAGDISRGSGAVPAALSQTYGLNRSAGAY